MPQPVAVLWLIKGLDAGGAEQLLLSTAEVMDRERFHLEVAYLVPAHAALVPRFRALRIPTHLLDGPNEYDPRWVLRLRRLVRRGRFDVVHTHSPYVASLARPALRTLPKSVRPRLIYTEHNLWGSRAWPTRVANRLTYSMDSEQLAVSEAVLRSVPPSLRTRLELLVHGTRLNPAPPETPGSVRRELGIRSGETLLLSVANLRPAKDHRRLLAVVRSLLDEGRQIRLAIAGHGPLEAELRDLIASLRLDDRVHLLGHRSDVQALLHDCDVFVLPSRWEGLPVALMEAMAAGVAIVATDVGGVSEAVRADVDGLLVSDPSVYSFAAAVSRVLDDPSLAARLRSSARERAGIFDIRRSTRRLEEIYAGHSVG